ncbi:MAG: ATP-binding protein [Tepidisphaeraceae bacterium]
MLKSIRWTLQLWHAGLLALVLVVFGTTTFFGIRQARYTKINADLEKTVQLIAAGVRPGPRMFRMPFGFFGDDPEPRPNKFTPELQLSPALEGRFSAEGDGTYFVVWGQDADIIRKSDNAPEVPEPPRDPNRPQMRDLRRQNDAPGEMPPPDGGPPEDGDRHQPPPAPQPPTLRTREGMREAVLQGPFGTRSVVVGRSIRAEQDELRRLGFLMAGTGAGVLGVGLIGGLLLATRVTRPIRTITAAAEAIDATNLSRRIDLNETESELGTLGSVLNKTFDRLETAIRQQVRFTADASHELRTPLAVMHTSLQLARSKERSAEEYRKTIDTCHRASTRMKDLVDSLLLLAGVDAGQLSLDRKPANFADIVQESIELIETLAAKKSIVIERELADAQVSVDRVRIAQVVTNLLSNAVRYNKEGGQIRVTLKAVGAMAELAVADTGVGIPAEHRTHLFERFYRVDPARSRAEGGSGLGLAIARSIAAAHGGIITFESPPEGGSVFFLSLPLSGPLR